MKCPLNTVTSMDRTHCTPKQHFIGNQPAYAGAEDANVAALIYHPSIFSSDVTLVNETVNPLNATYRICATQGAYCQNGFFGPIFQSIDVGANQHSVNQFYMSPMDRLDFSPISDMELERDDSQ